MSPAKITERLTGNHDRLFPVVGIGSSAGGVEACTQLLKHLPPTLGMAYVFVPHLDPIRESSLQDIFTRSTEMPVVNVEDGTEIQRNHIYLLKPGCEITISENVLRAADINPRPVRTAIDTFFRSLAAERANNAIGVVLSGTGADGTMGLAAIKGNGGITFAQDGSAKYDGMPASAIRAGVVDKVLTCEEIGNELGRIAAHEYVGSSDVNAAHTTDIADDARAAQMKQVFAILQRAVRVDFSEYKPPTIGRRVARRMALNRVDTLGDYVALLQREHGEVLALYQDLLINVTNFFRDAQAFEALKETVYPELLRARERTMTPIRIWVPGCSTGEEPYSHAITIAEFLSERKVEVPIQIFGTDLSETAVQRARTGIYSETIEADVSPVRLRRYFHRVDSSYQISKAIRDMCVYSTQNVFMDPPFSRIDLISCRNVMIYLGQSLQRRVIPIFHYALNASGFLMIGNTEGLLGTGAELFEIADKKQKIYRKRAVASSGATGFSIRMPERRVDTEAGFSAPRGVELTRVPADLQREADRLLLARYAPPSVLVDESLDIMQTKGHTGPYLELPPGKATLNLLKMARAGLLHELQSAIEEASKSGVEAVRPSVHVESDGGTPVAVRVIPVRTPVQDRPSFLVAFERATAEVQHTQAELARPLSDDERTLKEKQIAKLNQELAATKEYLQSIIEALEATNEELQSASEEIQSGNEELQSTNEELQTSKEELESANEELHTVNEEMQHRNDLLTQLNNDLTNLLNSVNLAIVMVGADLSVRRFTAQASKVLGLTATDLGRPISRLKLAVEIPDLEERMLEVMDDLRPKLYEITDGYGTTRELRIVPYRTSDNRIDGVIFSIVERDSVNRDKPAD